ncbi:MAG: transglutaminase-like domain-containing protein [Gemmatales bacterium]|nr:transglutaminase-like domain-containing protein [Gemmatales bacterium]MDW8223066.1 transglutaminase-like domain-containing protein [Gemmatales bacterium]
MVTMRCQHYGLRSGWNLACLLVILAFLGLSGSSSGGGVLAQPPNHGNDVQLGKVLSEVWEAVYLEGAKSGHAHHRFQEVTIRGKPFILATSTLELTVRRFGQPMLLAMSLANYETPAGQVASITVSMQVGREQRIVRRGTVVGNELVMQVQFGQQPPREVKIPWSPEAIGLYAEERFFTEHPWQPGRERGYVKFLPEIDRFVRCHVKAEDYEAGPHTQGRKWLRLRQRFDKVANLEIPETLLWLDEQGRLVRQESVWPEFGKMTLIRTNREQALASGDKPVVDIGLQQLVRLPQPIPNPHQVKKIVYRLQMVNGEFSEGLFPQDSRQRMLRREKALLELEVLGGVVPTGEGAQSQEPPAEYLRSNSVVNSEDKLVQELARRAIGTETQPWQKALRIERWVYANMKKGTLTEGFASADEVARTREGDCTEHAVLAAAMCRAVGVPSRLALGLAYVEHWRALVPHMWLEVWIQGRWYALDPTLGQGSVPATHVKIAHHSWNDVQPLRPLVVFRLVLPHLRAVALSWE